MAGSEYIPPGSGGGGQGPQGAQGAQGSTGATGAQGSTGAQGPQGFQGASGGGGGGAQPAAVDALGTVGASTVPLPINYSAFTATLTTAVSTPFTLAQASTWAGAEYMVVMTNGSGSFTYDAPTFSPFAGDTIEWLGSTPPANTGAGATNIAWFQSLGSGIIIAEWVTTGAGTALPILEVEQTVTGTTSNLTINDPVTSGITRVIVNFTAGDTTPVLFPQPAIGKNFRLRGVQPSSGAAGAFSWPLGIGWYGGGTGNTPPVQSTSNGLSDEYAFECDDGATWVGKAYIGAPRGAFITAVGNGGAGWTEAVSSTTTCAISVSPLSTNNVLVISAAEDVSTGTPPTISSIAVSSGSWSWSRVGSQEVNGVNGSELWMAEVAATGAITVTVTFSGTVSNARCTVQEFAAPNGTIVVDTSGGAAPSNPTSPYDFPSLTPAGSNEVYICAVNYAGSVSGTSITTSGYTSPSVDPDDIMYYNTNVSGVQAPAFAWTGTMTRITVAAALLKA